MIKVYDSNYHNSSSTPYKSARHMTDNYFDFDIDIFLFQGVTRFVRLIADE